MKLTQALRQPTAIGIGLFVIAAAVLIATIYTAHLGSISMARTLSTIAEPVCACAVAVLMYLAAQSSSQEEAQ